MRISRSSIFCVLLLLTSSANAQQVVSLSPLVQKYARVSTPKVVLEHVRVIDGTGRPPVEDQNVVIERGKIIEVRAGSDTPPADGTTVLDLRGYRAMLGIVGMHNHLFTGVRPNLDFEENQEGPVLAQQMIFSAPRLYLAAGVTTMRTTGSMNPYADLNLKHAIEVGTFPGPHMDLTGPFLEGAPATHIEQHELSGADEARQMVEYWADRGATSFKAYMHITQG
jgi:imidazolonepropionase-like amidohydrolase